MSIEEEFVPRMSPLAQRISRDGKTVQVEIYDDGNGRWLLEVVDQFNNSVVWEAPFDSDQEALDEVMSTIDDEGIDALIGMPEGQTH